MGHAARTRASEKTYKMVKQSKMLLGVHIKYLHMSNPVVISEHDRQIDR
jgi:hypothetical protein